MAPKASLKRPAAAAVTEAGDEAPPLAKRHGAAQHTETAAAAPAVTEASPRAPGGARSLQDVLRPVREGLVADGEPRAQAQCAQLRKVAEELMNGWDLWIAGQQHAIVELEAYVHGPQHPDPYTHGDDDQGRCGVWYFHKKGGSYKSGTFKGMDLTAGDTSAGVKCGLLVRSVRALESRAVTEGPCLVVDRILRLNGKASIAGFVAGRSAGELLAESLEGLQLRPSDADRNDAVWVAPRVGLVLRREEESRTHSAGSPVSYVARPYRFSTAPKELSKFRAGFVAAARLGGPIDSDALAKQLGLSKLQEYVAAVERGLESDSAQSFADKKIATQGELCELVGVCQAASLRSGGGGM